VLGAGKKEAGYGSKVLLDFNQAQLPPEDWEIEGYAFGTRRPDPGKRQRAADPSANQRQYQSGKMTSPEFVIEDDFLQVDCAGVYHPTLCTIRLVVDGEDVRACSPNQRAPFNKAGIIGQYWFDLRPLKGKRARIEVRDNHFNGWIEKVKIVSTSSEPPVGAHVITTVPDWLPDHHETTIRGDYLLLPVGPAVNTPFQEVAICIDAREKLVTDFPLAFGSIPVEGYLPVYDLTGYQGKNLKVSYHSFSGYDPSGEPAKFLVQREIPGRVIADNKPAFHIHCRIGRLNDPNGLCYLNGVYHLFHQYTYNIRAKSHRSSRRLPVRAVWEAKTRSRCRASPTAPMAPGRSRSTKAIRLLASRKSSRKVPTTHAIRRSSGSPRPKAARIRMPGTAIG